MKKLTDQGSSESNARTGGQPEARIGGLDRLFMLSPALLCIAGTDGYFKRVNPAFHEQLGHTESELLSRPFIDFVHPDDREATVCEVRKLSTGIPAVHFENRYVHANGSYRWLLWNTAPVPEEALLYASAINITERKQADKKLRAIAARLVLAEESERRRIARGLHDDVGQSLVAAKLCLGDLEVGVSGARDSAVRDLRGLLDRAIESTRTLTFELASAVLYEVGLGAALQSVCERTERASGIRFQPPAGLPGNPIPEPSRVLLYRVGCELIRNVVNHSRAEKAKVSLSRSGNHVRLTVEDDGCGFEVARGHQAVSSMARFGLFSIDQQLEPIGGRLEIDSAPGSGTRAVAVIPLAEPKKRI